MYYLRFVKAEIGNGYNTGRVSWVSDSQRYSSLRSPYILLRLRSNPKTSFCPICSRHTHLYKIMGNSYQYHNCKGTEQVGRKSFHNYSHQASARNGVLYRTHRTPYHILHNLKSCACTEQMRFILPFFRPIPYSFKGRAFQLMSN